MSLSTSLLFLTATAGCLILAAPQNSNNVAASQLATSPVMQQFWAMMPVLNYVCEMEEVKTSRLPMAKDRVACMKCKRDCREKSQCATQCNAKMTPEQIQTTMKTFQDPMCKPLNTCFHDASHGCDVGDMSAMTPDKTRALIRDHVTCLEKSCKDEAQKCSAVDTMPDTCSYHGCMTPCRQECRNTCTTQCAP